MINPIIKTNSKEVVSTGTVISYNNEPIEISFPTSNGGLVILFVFSNDETGEPRVNANVVSEKKLELTFFNFNNSLGQGNTEPMQIGELNNKQLYLNFRIYALDKTAAKTLHFTFYLGL